MLIKEDIESLNSPVGATVKLSTGITVRIVDGHSSVLCGNCAFSPVTLVCGRIACTPGERADRKSVHFIEVLDNNDKQQNTDTLFDCELFTAKYVRGLTYGRDTEDLSEIYGSINRRITEVVDEGGEEACVELSICGTRIMTRLIDALKAQGYTQVRWEAETTALPDDNRVPVNRYVKGHLYFSWRAEEQEEEEEGEYSEAIPDPTPATGSLAPMLISCEDLRAGNFDEGLVNQLRYQAVISEINATIINAADHGEKGETIQRAADDFGTNGLNRLRQELDDAGYRKWSIQPYPDSVYITIEWGEEQE